MIPCPALVSSAGSRAGGFDVNKKCEESLHLKPRKEEAAVKGLIVTENQSVNSPLRVDIHPSCTEVKVEDNTIGK